MAFIRDISDRFWSYVSPRKTQQKRDKEFKAKVPPLPRHTRQMPEITLDEPSSAKEMTPDTLFQRWKIATPSPRELRNYHSPDMISPSPPSSLERAYTDFEGDTLIDNIAQTLNSDPAEEWDANEETYVLDEADYVEQRKQQDAELERQRRERQGQELRNAGWTEDAIFLFQKLGMRGFEPLLPATWFADFPMLPADLFTRNIDKAFVKPSSPDVEYHAFRALDELFGLGGRVRDAVLQKAPIRTAEKQIRAAVLKYNKWALRDGKIDKVWRDSSLFEIISVPKHISASVAEAKMLRKLNKRAELWREGFEERRIQRSSLKNGKEAQKLDDEPELPTLYGVVACHTVMAFVSYDSQATVPLLRTVAMFDLGQEGYDVWNSLAIAIFVIHCRNRLLELRDSLPQPEQPSTPSDPDA
ncbi:uncharacterized protein EI97DRAFT_433958 [Westerdykella ornata]|uniref:Uncharacterized protein n=1 Tax=Westerdykella ornata TaxID=318751 RepID=A0A6A6JKY1_WESOR|nr:uncharacterized protein EI97DRAFT_433958 [Westerdykella ornata]KAF2275549.1 hypothetical protein EI97DRAFT_433958 [Westerdykella ornata]